MKKATVHDKMNHGTVLSGGHHRDMKKATVHDKMNSGHVVHFQGLEPWAR